MIAAHESDTKAYARDEASFERVRLLPEVVENVSKLNLQDGFIDNGGLIAIREWLSRLPDGELPNTSIRTELIGVLERLLPKIEVDHLKSSKVGVAVKDLLFSSDETSSNKKRLSAIVDKWLRSIMVFGEGDQVEKASFAETVAAVQAQAKPKSASGTSAQRSTTAGRPGESLKHRLGKASENYSIVPRSAVEPIDSGIDASLSRIHRAASSTFGARSKRQKTMSVEGRGVQV